VRVVSTPPVDRSRRDALVEQLGGVLAQLRDATGALRTTLRIDLPAYDFHVDLAVAEALAPGARSLLAEGSMDQRAAPTARWLERERRLLVQPDFDAADPRPPPALIAAYGVQAQMLGPIQSQGHLTGWISVHSQLRRERWTEAEIAALEQAIEETRHLLGLPP
jgi:maleate isomerase